MTNRVMLAVADGKHAHFKWQHPIITLIANDFGCRFFGQHQPAHKRVVVDVHVVDEAIDDFASINGRYWCGFH